MFLMQGIRYAVDHPEKRHYVIGEKVGQAWHTGATLMKKRKYHYRLTALKRSVCVSGQSVYS